MKKKVSLLLGVLMLFSCVTVTAGALEARIDPRWSYMQSLALGIEEDEDGNLFYGADAYAYTTSGVDEIEVTVTLQQDSSSGWLNLAVRTGREDGIAASAGGTYKNPVSGVQYRIKVYATAYIDGREVEEVGPSYYYYTMP